MGLTDISTLILAITATILATTLTALFWSTIFRKGFANLFLRFSLILICQVLAISTVGIGVNRIDGFFSSWSDLLGKGTDYSSTAVASSQLRTIDSAMLKKATPLAGGSLLREDVITGEKSKVSNIVYLDLPASAVRKVTKSEPLNPRHYRIVEFLTGFPSQPIMWFKVMKIGDELARYNSSHPGREIIGIFPQVNVAGNYDLECMNLPHGQPKAESWLSEDMHSYIHSTLGLDGAPWSIVGLSTGGWCAAMLSIRHPDLYSSAISIAGYYRPALPLSDPITLQEWAKKNYNLAPYEATLKDSKRLYLVASLGDKYSIKETKKFLAKPHPHLAITYKELKSGGHNPHVWVTVLRPALNWL